jgi:DNA polymerase III gamma/tau subunit
MSLYQKYRPTTFDEVYGQDEAVKILKAVTEMPQDKRPHVFLFGGASGCGKTTLAKVFARAIGVDPETMNFRTLDASKDRSIERIRELSDQLAVRPMGNKAQGRIFLLDEAHQLLKPAQEALLKMCEDTPSSAYIIFATTEPDQLGKALRSRCKTITIKALSPKAIYQNLKRVATAECIDVSDEDLQKIAQNSDNSARVSLQILETYVLNGGNIDKAISMNGGTGEELKAETINLCRAIVSRKDDWAMVVDFCTKYKGQSEPVRQAVLGYLKACLMKARSKAERVRFAGLIECFLEPHYDCGDVALLYQIATAFEVK